MTAMKLADALRILDDLAPLRYAESWDNVGLLVGDPDADVRRVLVAVDFDASVAEEARVREADLVVAYHPPLFSAVKRVPHGAPWAQAVRNGIALYSPHTALDVALEGTNDFLADVAGVARDRRLPLRAWTSPGPSPEPSGIGLGRIGDVGEASLEEIVARVKRGLGLEHVLVAGRLDHVVRRVAVAAGAGGELVGDAVRGGASVLVTGEIRHHDALGALARGMAVVATLHSNSERAAVRAFAGRLGHRLGGIEVVVSDRDADPFRIV